MIRKGLTSLGLLWSVVVSSAVMLNSSSLCEMYIIEVDSFPLYALWVKRKSPGGTFDFISYHIVGACLSACILLALGCQI